MKSTATILKKLEKELTELSALYEESISEKFKLVHQFYDLDTQLSVTFCKDANTDYITYHIVIKNRLGKLKMFLSGQGEHYEKLKIKLGERSVVLNLKAINLDDNDRIFSQVKSNWMVLNEIFINEN
ncbi:hypothetical protein K8354_04540 [Polaribacter litorisediminis]|uniref:hypothetical protein n=1 Tax=Polaribacter litorisediminis TaxID=1908341 RepID=UPI001CC02BAB|nr:hypothetical protein [Polaribacter litorisediminis]UAM99098.1 hypothetical protein K8354_04540 [Polaribacter litorisediminis]